MGQYKKELKNWKVIIIMVIIFALAYIFYNIDYLLCGTLSYKYQNRIDKVQKEYSSLFYHRTQLFFYFLNLIL